MSDFDFFPYFEEPNIAEITSSSLIDFKNAFQDYFYNNHNSSISSLYFKEFGLKNIGEINNSLLKEFGESFQVIY